jgi:dihydrofolate reductase / thymidylate synthase
MFNIILAHDNNYGIGKNNELPWFFTSDMRYFKSITSPKNFLETSIVIMGRKTMESIPNYFLPNRINIIISNTYSEEKEDLHIVNNFNKALDVANSYEGCKIWVIGGSSIYDMAFRHKDLNNIYITKINGNFECDTFVKLPEMTLINKYIFTEKDIGTGNLYNLEFCKYKPKYNGEQQYLQLLEDIMVNGKLRQTRNAKVYSKFSRDINFDVSNSFPLLTTKRMFWKGIVEELLFFIRGETNTIKLSEKGVRIWEGNTSRKFLDMMSEKNIVFKNYNIGDMGPMYGYQWRFFNKPYKNKNGGIDQFYNLIELIKKDKHSRRLVMTDFNPEQVSDGVLYPCHSLILQFYCEDNRLSVKMYQRSADLFLGLPFNIASTSLLLYIVSKLVDMTPHMVTLTLGDCHIYEQHIEQVKKQLNRLPHNLPTLTIPDFKTIEQVEESKLEDYILNDYKCYSGIKANMVA